MGRALLPSGQRRGALVGTIEEAARAAVVWFEVVSCVSSLHPRGLFLVHRVCGRANVTVALLEGTVGGGRGDPPGGRGAGEASGWAWPRGRCLIPVLAQPSPPAGNVGGQRRVCETVPQPGRVCVWGCGSAWFLQGAGQRVIREEAAQRPVQRSAHRKAAQHLVACACDSACRLPPWPPAQCAALELT